MILALNFSSKIIFNITVLYCYRVPKLTGLNEVLAKSKRAEICFKLMALIILMFCFFNNRRQPLSCYYSGALVSFFLKKKRAL